MTSSQSGNMYINLISDRPANIAKALRFGRQFLKAGWQVVLSVNMDAVKLVIPEADLGSCPVTGIPLPEVLQSFHAEGGRVVVGKECLMLAGMDPGLLHGDFELSSPELILEIMSTPDLKILGW